MCFPARGLPQSGSTGISHPRIAQDPEPSFQTGRYFEPKNVYRQASAGNWPDLSRAGKIRLVQLIGDLIDQAGEKQKRLQKTGLPSSHNQFLQNGQAAVSGR
jgi:hypothetical protein